MVHFHVVDDYVVQLLDVSEVVDFFEQFTGERVFDGVYKGGFFVHYEVGVVHAAFVGDVAVEVADVPVDDSDPFNVGC